nr:hypothetical protein [Tanacetum cinerariifolium]
GIEMEQENIQERNILSIDYHRPFIQVTADCDEIPKRPTMHLNLWSYKVVRHMYSNLMIQLEPEGSTQGYPLVSVEVLRTSDLYESTHNEDGIPSRANIKRALAKQSMPVYDTDIEDVIKEEEGFVGKEGFGGEEDSIEDV